jgi:hypothetical protein
MAYNDFEELAKIAYKGEELSDFAPLPTKYMYLRLSVLYDCFAKGRYSKGQCVEIKNELRREYQKIMQEHDRDMECYREYLTNRRVNTELLIKLEKSNNRDEMLDACLKIVGNCLNDKSLYDRNRLKGKQLDF